MAMARRLFDSDGSIEVGSSYQLFRWEPSKQQSRNLSLSERPSRGSSKTLNVMGGCFTLGEKNENI